MSPISQLKFCLLTLVLFVSTALYAQNPDSAYFGPDPDPCHMDEIQSAMLLKVMGPGWGYTYDSLLTDLGQWESSPYLVIDSIGASVQDRAIWRITITDTGTATVPRIRISVHTRTHPSEVQSGYVTKEIIRILSDSSDLALLLRKNCIFNIVPMYNPDGVELGIARANANNVDLERDWDTASMQPESAALKKTFESYMASESPVRIALNMHSAGNCKRFFVYHHETGTSSAFALKQKFFITSIRDHWPDGFENWDYFVSWFENTPTYYPESWFWLNYQEDVMALTYEDMNCIEAGQYDKTALTLLSGIRDYLGLEASYVEKDPEIYQAVNTPTTSFNAWPNPLTPGSRLNINIQLKNPSYFELSVYNILGQKISRLYSGSGIPGNLGFSADLRHMSAGMYYLVFRSGQEIKAMRLILIP